ncbi:hypothetical protein ABZ756_13820 [Mammaliicoccus sciuri]|uniref:DUF2634 domain-containing protein n=1 Tax=Sporosarcina newyorkensis TaxID=759851 RepID=A0A1T4YUX4_9BACL|nr:hypothetical protein [Sporosarcina newyorkensis]SKB05091.1 hypothetical protein SAMN04244570_3551 [Sporosarcina newyorkensis]
MKALKIEDGDIVIDQLGNFVVIEEEEEEGQSLERALTTNKEEWFLNILHGLAYSVIFAKPFDEQRSRLAIIETIHQDERVDQVEKVEFFQERPKRKAEVLVRVRMNSGNVIEEVFPIG